MIQGDRNKINLTDTVDKMEITCIGHSGFLVAMAEHNLVFDYYTDKKGIISKEIFAGKKTCVFVSHSHADHYNKKIFDWAAFGDVAYVLDSGCKIPDNAANITKVKEGEELGVFDGEINIKTYGSTDLGVSFFVRAGGFCVFHAGDLNDWYWEDESTPEELAKDESDYIEIIKKLAGQKIDVAFVPKDLRLGKNAGRGVKHFAQIVAPKKIIPMHFPGNDGARYEV